MPNIVKLMAVIDGSSTPVGSCHPGQARLLQKKGMASWRDGKLWLSEPPVEHPPVTIRIESTGEYDAAQRVFEAVSQGLADSKTFRRRTIHGEPTWPTGPHPNHDKFWSDEEVGHTKEYEAKGHPVSHDPLGTALNANAQKALSEVIGQPPLVNAPTPVGRTGMVVRLLPEDVTPAVPADLWAHPPLKLDDEALLEAGVEPGEWQDKILFRSQSSPAMKDCEVSSFRVLLREYLRRVGVGHSLHAYDDYSSRMVGFIDNGDGSDTTKPEYVCVSLTRSGLASITEDDATPFGMSSIALQDLLRTPSGREQVFGKWASEGSGEEPDDVDIEWGDGGYPEIPPEFFLHIPVGADYVVSPVDLTPKDGESPADRATVVAQERASQPRPARRVTGWTSFRWPEAYSCTPVVCTASNAEGTPEPYPKLDEFKEQASLAGEPNFFAPVVRYGVYRRVKDHLFRVWAEGGWDESLLRDDGLYYLQTCSQRVDAFIVGSGNNIDILAPAGFEGCLEEAEKRAAEVLRGGGT